MAAHHIFFTAYGGGHAPTLIPVIKAMQARGHRTSFLALTTAAKIAADAGLDYLTMQDVVPQDDPDLQRFGEALAANHHTDGKGIAYEESVAYLGASFRDLAKEIGEDSAWARYKEKGLNAFCPTQTARRILQQYAPDVVVATASPRMEQAMLHAAHALHIPSLCMVGLFREQEAARISRLNNGDYLAVSQPGMVNRMIEKGRPADKIINTGSPMFEEIATQAFVEGGLRWREKHVIKSTEKLVLWAEQPEPEIPELPMRIRFFLADICAQNGWKFVVRLHPTNAHMVGTPFPSDTILSPISEPLHEVLSACDLCVTLTSTVGWEALLAGKPLAVARVSPYSDIVTYGQGDGALAVDTVEELAEALPTLLNDTPKARELEALRKKLPSAGGACERLCDFIETQLLAQKDA